MVEYVFSDSSTDFDLRIEESKVTIVSTRLGTIEVLKSHFIGMYCFNNFIEILFANLSIKLIYNDENKRKMDLKKINELFYGKV